MQGTLKQGHKRHHVIKRQIFGILVNTSLKTKFASFLLTASVKFKLGYALWFSGLFVYSVAKAETTEGLFDVIFSLGTSIDAGVANVALRDVLLEFPFAEDHSALDSLSVRTRQ